MGGTNSGVGEKTKLWDYQVSKPLLLVHQQLRFLTAGIGCDGVGQGDNSPVEPSDGIRVDQSAFVESKMAAILLLDVQKVRLLLWNKNEACQPELAIKTKTTRELRPKREWGNG